MESSIADKLAYFTFCQDLFKKLAEVDVMALLTNSLPESSTIYKEDFLIWTTPTNKFIQTELISVSFCVVRQC